MGFWIGGVQCKAVREMPRPYVDSVEQAQVTVPVSKSSLTTTTSGGQQFVKTIRTVTTQDQSQQAKKAMSVNVKKVVACHV